MIGIATFKRYFVYIQERDQAIQGEPMSRPPLVSICVAAVMAFRIAGVSAMQPPTPEQLERYRADGTLDRRADAARRIGNHQLSPALMHRLGSGASTTRNEDTVRSKTLPSLGRQRVFALLIGFADYPGQNPANQINRRLFREGPVGEYPYESLRDYYRRSSFGLLELEGATLGWYTAPYPMSAVQQTDEGREALIREVIDHFDAQGHDFSQYDNDGDGSIDYFLVFYAGPHQEWGDFWWGYQRTYEDESFVVDGVGLGAYSWQWESWNVGGPFSARVAIHETGHALGLPDYYDYDEEIGPMGGLGGLDMMDNNWGDHNPFSKYLLGWIEPTAVNEGFQRLSLRPSNSSGDAVLLMHGDPVNDPLGEYFVAQYRWRSGNDVGYPADGLLIWHIDARVDGDGRFLFDNSYTDHKLIRLMEADGLEEIEQNLGADSGDFFSRGDVFSSSSVPSSDRYDGSPTNLFIDSIERSAGSLDFDADLGSGCGIFADVAEPVTAWPGITAPFRAEVDFANCSQAAPIEWVFGDGSFATGATGDHVFGEEGRFSWTLTSTLGDTSLAREGEVLVCSDPRCFQWRLVSRMRGPRLAHSAVVLSDGRVLVVGGGVPPEVFDPRYGQWSATGPMSGAFGFASAQRLTDGRVLVTGSSAGNPVNAEIYDPVSDAWSVTGRMIADRVMHSSIRLADGRVLVAGGTFEGTGAVVSELFDPVTGSWTASGGTGFEEVPGLALLPDDEILFVGRKQTRIFNPTNERWRRISDMVHEHKWGATVGFTDGRVMVIGGEATVEVEIFDPTLNLWRPAPQLPGIRAVASAAALPSGHVVVTGGADRFWRIGSSVEVLDPATGDWTVIQSMARPRLAHTISVLHDGSILVTGGTTSVLEEPFDGQGTAERFLMPVQITPARRATGQVTP
jgi:M6 family metalloprotease-like protein